MKQRSGNKIDLSIMPFQALNQKAISALTSGVVSGSDFPRRSADDSAAERLER